VSWLLQTVLTSPWTYFYRMSI